MHLGVLNAVIAALQALLLGVAALVAWRSLRASRAVAKVDNVVRYFERYWSRDFNRSVSFVMREFGLSPGASDQEIIDHRQKYLRATYSERLALFRVLNFFEELGTVYEGGVLDNKLILSMFSGHSIQMWGQFKWLVDDLRGRAGGRIFNQWEILELAAEERDRELKAAGK